MNHTCCCGSHKLNASAFACSVVWFLALELDRTFSEEVCREDHVPEGTIHRDVFTIGNGLFLTQSLNIHKWYHMKKQVYVASSWIMGGRKEGREEGLWNEPCNWQSVELHLQLNPVECTQRESLKTEPLRSAQQTSVISLIGIPLSWVWCLSSLTGERGTSHHAGEWKFSPQLTSHTLPWLLLSTESQRSLKAWTLPCLA